MSDELSSDNLRHLKEMEKRLKFVTTSVVNQNNAAGDDDDDNDNDNVDETITSARTPNTSSIRAQSKSPAVSPAYSL